MLLLLFSVFFLILFSYSIQFSLRMNVDEVQNLYCNFLFLFEWEMSEVEVVWEIVNVNQFEVEFVVKNLKDTIEPFPVNNVFFLKCSFSLFAVLSFIPFFFSQVLFSLKMKSLENSHGHWGLMVFCPFYLSNRKSMSQQTNGQLHPHFETHTKRKIYVKKKKLKINLFTEKMENDEKLYSANNKILSLKEEKSCYKI